MSCVPPYVLGDSAGERDRLAMQARILQEWTAGFLRAAPFSAGMHILDVGCGLGDVSFLAGDIVGPNGSVLGERLALKTIIPYVALDGRYVARLLREVKLARKIASRHVCRVHDVGHHDSRSGRIYFITMELLEGETLTLRLRRCHRMSTEEAFPLIQQMADALQAAHEQSIIHRDFKPANIMLVAENGGTRVVVTDFGLARSTDATQTLYTRIEGGSPPGTMGYIAPELYRPGALPTVASDIYSLGVVIREMVTGLGSSKGNSPSRSSPQLNARWENAIRRCLETDPDRRFTTAQEVVNALRPETRPVRFLTWARRHPFVAITAGTLFAALIGLAVSWWDTRSTEVTLSASPVPLTSYPGHQVFPSISPDGTRVAFSWDEPGKHPSHIYVKMIGPGEPVRLTTNPTGDFAPAWSPDGQSIAFLRARDDYHAGVIVMSAMGGQERELAAIVFATGEILFHWSRFLPSPLLTWSADGKWLLSVDQSSGVTLNSTPNLSEQSRRSKNVGSGPENQVQARAIIRISVDTGEKRAVTSPPRSVYGDGGLALSPTGTTLAFVRTIGRSASDIYMVPVSEDSTPRAEPIRVTFDRKEIDGLAWAPDGRNLVFSSSRNGKLGLWRMAPKPSSTPTRLMVGGDNPIHVAISQQAHRLVYSHDFGDEPNGNCAIL
jgi:serine/threonine protein kinase